MEGTLRKYVRSLLEIQGSADLVAVEVRLRVRTATKDQPDAPTVPDIMTNIRVIEGVSIVRQTIPIKRLQGDRDILELEIKYMPKSVEMRSAIAELGKEVKAVPGVEIVKVTKIGGRPVRQATGAGFIF